MIDIVVHTVDGVTREFKKVQRKADAGEWVLITNATNTTAFKPKDIGLIVKVTEANCDTCGGMIHEHCAVGQKALYHNQYVVLEPTDVVVHDGKRYRTVKRKANVGELALVVNHLTPSTIGKVVFVNRVAADGHIYYEAPVKDAGTGSRPDNYIVLEPLEDVCESSPASSSADCRIAALEERVAALEKRLDGRNVAEGLEQSIREMVQLREGTLPKRKWSKELTRDEIVERAKRDVVILTKKMASAMRNHEGNYTFQHRGTTPRFVVNRDKRTVVALVEDKADGIIERGKAKCAPDDVFNVNIGSALALRRALGLDVPDEYVNAPKPTDVRVGDVVSWGYRGVREIYEIIGKRGDRYDFMKLNNGSVVRDVDYYPHSLLERLIDDSGRYNYTAEE